MSRIGKLPISIPAGVTVTLKDNVVTVKGPKGEMSQYVNPAINVAICHIFNSRCRRVRFARFYIVCEEVPLGTPESPPIVCGLSDTLRESSNVAKTRNGMPSAAWKKYVNFASKNLPSHVYSGTFLFSTILIILLINAKYDKLNAAIITYQRKA